MKRERYPLLGLPIVLLLAVAFVASPSSVDAAEEPDGKTIFVGNKCNMCHSVPSAGIEAKVKSEKMKGPDMTAAAARLDPEQLAKYLRKQEQLDGKDHKKEYKGNDEELKALIAWLQSLKDD